MSEVGEGAGQIARTGITKPAPSPPPERLIRAASEQEVAVLTDSQKELIMRALKEVDGVYEGTNGIKTANGSFGKETYSALSRVYGLLVKASSRENGYSQLDSLYETIGSKIKTALSQLENQVEKLRLPSNTRYEIKRALVQTALLYGQAAQQHGDEAIRQLEALITKVDKTSEELKKIRRGCSGQVAENQEESSRIAWRFTSELTQGYARASQRLRETVDESGKIAERAEDKERETNKTRKAEFERIIGELVASIPKKLEPATFLASGKP